MSARWPARLLACALAIVAANVRAGENAGDPGHLEAGGGYLSPVPGATVTVLRDGSVLVLGHGPTFDERLPQRELTRQLRERRQARALATPDPGPKWWDATARGWRRLPNAPDCDGAIRYLHSATLLADGRVLVAGGLCDFPKMADDAAPWPAHRRTAFWDPASRRWSEGPALRVARIHHSATAMPGGSVIFAGGESDSLLWPPGEEPVVADVEIFTGMEMISAPSLSQARARHAATAMADGTLVVSGGFGADGRALASVEALRPGAREWTALPPMHTARHSHTATLLADGRLLVAGGKDADERALASTEIWDPARGAWLAGPDLPVPLNGHASARLANGDVLVAGGAWIASPLAAIPWAWTWSAASGDWKVAGTALPQDPADLSAGVTIAPRPDGGALVFTSRTILRWRPGAGAGEPRWDTRPSIAALRGGRAMVVGYEVGGETNTAIARVWDAASNRWSDAGTPFGRERMEGATAELPSGRVIHVGVDMDNTLRCRVWDPPARWDDCGSLKLEYLHRGRPEIGALPDGRAFAIVGEHEAAVLDEGSRTWRATKVEWNRNGFAYGAPVVHDTPFARLDDPLNGQSIAIDDAGARYYNANLSGGSVSMLWDPSASRWAYVFVERRMGADARWLPGGCAISTSPLALFDPTRAEARALADPGLGVAPHQGAMAVLDDGTVVVAGVGAAGSGGFFHRKAGCGGFAPAADDDALPYIAPERAVDAAPMVTMPAKAAAPAPTGFDAWMTRLEKGAWQNRWLLLAILGPLALYLLLRRTRIGRARAPASRGFRIAIYAILAVVLAPFVLQYVLFYVVTSASRCAESPLQCKSDPPWWVALARKARPQEPPPCRLVGVWASQRGGEVHPIELKDDGTYAMKVGVWASQRGGEVHPIELKDDGTYAMKVGTRRYTGLWRVQGGKMIWQHEQAPGARDVNPMEFLGDTRFNLTEENGQVTRYELIRAIPSDKCTK